MVLNVHLEGTASYDIGDEIWQESLTDAINTEAETIANYAGADLLKETDQPHRDALRDRIAHEMTAALAGVGDRYQAPDGVLYSLTDEPPVDRRGGDGRLNGVSTRSPEPIVDEVLRFEDLPLGSAGTRRAIVRWSDGTEGAAMTWYPEEILVCEGDHGNSRLMSSRVEMRGVAGSVGIRGSHNLRSAQLGGCSGSAHSGR
jgi:hypothetical protein